MEKVSATQFVRIWATLGLLALILIWFLPWRFQTNDDEIMMWLVSGAYTGTPESFAVFIHPMLSWVFAKLYTFFPEIPWYPVTWFSVIFLSYLGLVLSLSKTKMDFLGKNIISLFILFLFLHFAIFLQFTIVSGISAFSGFLLLIIFQNEKSNVLLLFSIVLLTFSVLIRWESFALIALGFGLYFLSFKQGRTILTHFNLFLIPFILCLSLVGTKLIYEKQADYADYIAYNYARAGVSDHPVSYKLLLDGKLDRHSSWFFFYQWMMEDDKLSTDDLKTRKSELNTNYLQVNQLLSSFTRLTTVMRAEAFKSIFSFMLLIFYFFKFGTSRRALVFLSSWVLFFLIFNHFFILNGRVVVLFFLPFLFPLIAEPISLRISNKLFVAVSIVLSLFFGYHVTNFVNEAQGRQIMQDQYLSLLEKVPENAVVVLEGYKENYLKVIYTMNNPTPLFSLGWISKSPFQQKRLSALGLSKLSDTNEFYLLGVDAKQDYFFPDYMNYIGGHYQLESKIELDNFILFHYTKTY